MFIENLILASLAVFIHLTIFFAISLIKNNNNLIDIAWGIGFIFIALLSLFLNENFQIRQLIVTSLIILWGVRLTSHIYSRIKKVKKNFDYYERLKEKDERTSIIKKLLYAFVFQLIVLLLMIYPVLFINSVQNPPLRYTDFIGLVIWVIGFFFESIGDFQLAKFNKKSENRNKILKKGLWKFTRHPNYFGETLMWWGIFIFATSLPGGWITVVGPLTITYILFFVSGIPLIEKEFENNLEYQEYKKTTNVFIPWFPKK